MTPAGTILPSLMYWLIISAVADLLQGNEGTGECVVSEATPQQIKGNKQKSHYINHTRVSPLVRSHLLRSSRSKSPADRCT